VLVVAPTPFFADRGCHVRIYEQARALRSRGVRVLVATYPLGRSMPDVDTVRTMRLPGYRKLEAGPSVYKPFLDGLLLERTWRAARAFRPHLVHAHLHEGAAIGIALRKLTGLPVVFDIQGSLADELTAHRALPRDGALRRWVLAFERGLYRRPDALVVNSRSALSMLRERFGVAAGRTFVVPDAVDGARFAPRDGGEVRRRLGLGDGPVIGFLGLLNTYQGVDLLLDALPRVLAKRPDARLLLMGYPDDGYRRRVDAAGLSGSVLFTGRLPYEEAPEHLGAVTVAVSPKMSETEGNGKLLNYMAAGLPVVAFDSPVNREILGDDGWFVAQRNAEAFADALIGALDAPDGRGERLRRRADERFSWDAGIDELLAAYRAATTGRA
jgi:glycosyltransferase involved in cell wall biosynthesis